MLTVFSEFPVTCMVLLSLVILAIVYRLVRYGIKIKAGSVEIDADNPDVKEVK